MIMIRLSAPDLMILRKKENVWSTITLVSAIRVCYTSIHRSLSLASSLFYPLSLSLHLPSSLSLSLYPLCSWRVLASTPLHYDIMFAALSTAECLNVGYIVAAHSSQPYNTANANSLSA